MKYGVKVVCVFEGERCEVRGKSGVCVCEGERCEVWG